MTVKFKLLEADMIKPSKATVNSAAWDLYLPHTIQTNGRHEHCVPLGIAFDIPEGYCIKVYPRSSTMKRYGFIMPTTIVDSDYKGEVHAIFYSTHDFMVEAGSRIAQFVVEEVTDYALTMVEDIGDSERGDKGLGSSGV